MFKIINGHLILFLLILIGSSCSPDDEMQPPMEPDPMATLKDFSISIPNDYYLDIQGYKESGEMFIVKEDGNIFDRSILVNGQTSTIELDEELSTNSFGLILLTKGELATSSIYDFDMYSEVTAASFEFLELNRMSSNIDDRAKIVIDNTNISLDDIHYSNNGGSSSSSMNTTFDILLDSIPDHFYCSFYNSQEEKFRYFWKEGIGVDETVNVDYNTLPIIELPSLFTFPENEFSTMDIDGKMTNQIKKNIVEYSDINGAEQTNIYFPSNLFDKYHVRKSVTKSDYKLSYNSFSESIDYDFVDPNIACTIQSSDINNIELQTSGDYSFYDVKFSFNNTDENYQVSWSFLGGDSEMIQPIMPNIEIAEIVGDDNFTVEDLNFIVVWLDKVEGINEVEDHIYYSADRGRKLTERLTYTRYSRN